MDTFDQFQVGDDVDNVHERSEAGDQFPQNLENGTKYTDVSEKRKRLR